MKCCSIMSTLVSVQLDCEHSHDLMGCYWAVDHLCSLLKITVCEGGHGVTIYSPVSNSGQRFIRQLTQKRVRGREAERLLSLSSAKMIKKQKKHYYNIDSPKTV